jgi:hypothetical protein
MERVAGGRLSGETIMATVLFLQKYLHERIPISSAMGVDPSIWLKFISTLKRKNRARVKINSILYCNERKVGVFEGDFVAIDSQTA